MQYLRVPVSGIPAGQWLSQPVRQLWSPVWRSLVIQSVAGTCGIHRRPVAANAASQWGLSMIRHGISAVLVCAATVLGLAGRTYAQAPAPYGVWAIGNDSSNYATFIITPNGCQFKGTSPNTGPVLIAGACSWDSTSRGGILTIMNVYNYQPAPIRYNIVWINQTTITVYGDVYHKTGD